MLGYLDLERKMAETGNAAPSPQEIFDWIVAIRRAKLPDWRVLGNAGSFFKNPLVSATLVAQLKGEYPDLVAYTQPDGQMKLAAGWLIERAGWKGFREADAGVHKMQALVLVNYGSATGLQLLDLAQRIQKDISERFHVDLEMEPNRY